jgi:hypothetical protein
MLTTIKSSNDDNIKLSKEPFSIPLLIMGLLFSTYFLTIQTIELSLSIYVLQENKFEIYREYLLFKRQAPIWKWWQLFTLITLLFSIIIVVRDLLQILTRKATFKRHLLDIVTALHLFVILYISFKHILPLQNKLIQSISIDNIRELNFYQWIIFLLNIIGWFIPIFRYQDWKNDKNIHPKKKTQ